MSEFVLLCDGGLGNRVGVLLGGIIIAKQLNMEPIICWPANTWCGCYFEDIFKTNLKVVRMNIRELFEAKKDHTFMIHSNQIGATLQHVVPLSPEGVAIIRATKCNVVYYNDKVPPFVNSDTATKVLDDFVISDAVSSKVEDFCRENTISRQVTGIHIRKTDWVLQLDESMLIQQIVSRLGTKFFVCSDDQATEARFKSLPGVIVYDKKAYAEKLEEGDWNKTTTDAEGRSFQYNVNRPRESIIEAFIDLLILSKTTIAYGSQASSFFQLAKRYEQRNLCR